MKIRTSLTTLLGIDAPVVQAPMAEAATPQLAAAICNAGGLGMLSGTWRTPANLREAIRQTKTLTAHPFAVNLALEWQQDERISIALAEGVRLFSFFWGNPEPHIAAIHEAGGSILHTVGTAEEARFRVAQGIDVIVAQGWEAGGHVWGTVATLPLIPAVVDAVTPVPVIAAGGIADGRGLAAALLLGASGVWIGTRFLLSDEADAHPHYKERLATATENGTILSTVFDGEWECAPHRTLINETTQRWQEAGSPPPGSRPGEGQVVARAGDGSPIPRYHSNFPQQDSTGNVEAMALYAGQSVGLSRSIRPASEILHEVVNDAATLLVHAGKRWLIE